MASKGTPSVERDLWVQCDSCGKWRRLAPDTVIDDNASWCGPCVMNKRQRVRASCILLVTYRLARDEQLDPAQVTLRQPAV